MSDETTELLRLQISDQLDQDPSDEALADVIDGLTTAQIADVLESLPHSYRERIWPQISLGMAGEILLEVGENARVHLLKDMSANQIAAVIEALPDVDDQADLTLSLDIEMLPQVLNILDDSKRQKLESLLSYPEDTAGGLMDLQAMRIRSANTVEVVLRYLRLRGELPDHTDRLFVVDRRDRLLGELTLAVLLTHDSTTLVGEIFNHEPASFSADTPATEVARIFADDNLVSAAVVDENNHLIGRITIDDVVDVILVEREHEVMSMAGLSEEDDLFAPIWSSTRRRAIWLGINLATAFLASWVIGLFEATLDQVVALAVLMSIVPSMGGIAGNQTLTIMIRGLALGQVGTSNFNWLLGREIAVGLLNGLMWALVVALLAWVWFADWRIAVIIAAALMLNLVAAALAGASIPVIMKKQGIDPALAGGVVLTTVTDIVGVTAFLGLATLILI